MLRETLCDRNSRYIAKGKRQKAEGRRQKAEEAEEAEGRRFITGT
jgi:hypothetical protein